MAYLSTIDYMAVSALVDSVIDINWWYICIYHDQTHLSGKAHLLTYVHATPAKHDTSSQGRNAESPPPLQSLPSNSFCV